MNCETHGREACPSCAPRCACHSMLDCPTLGRIIHLPGGQTARVIDDGMADQPATRKDGSVYGLRFRVLRVVPA